MANSLKTLQETRDLATVQRTSLSNDILGRYICSTFEEAQCSTSPIPCLDRHEVRADARPFDMIVIGGGTFGAVAAEHLWFRDTTRAHRILVLEAGPFVLPEHVQNLPMLGLDAPGATTIEDLRAEQRRQGKDDRDPLPPRKEVWGLAWQGDRKFPGLAYCVGGRSLYWGGWSPRLLEAEMPFNCWPEAVVDDLNQRYFDEAARQIGVTETNDFIHGELHRAIRQQLFDGINAGQVTGAIPLAELRLHLDDIDPFEQEISKLEAPLAVQGRGPRAGFFPFNKFSSVPLLITAARSAQQESGGDDVTKRLMIVPNCHVTRLVTEEDGDTWRVTAVETSQGTVPVPFGGAVFIALGTIESARLALVSFKDRRIPDDQAIGRNLMAHLRSNLEIRIPRTALATLDSSVKELETSALFVKGRHRHDDRTTGHFHLQITASGLGQHGTNSEAELFKKIPDIDLLDRFKGPNVDDTHVVITIRGIGEMEPDNPNSHVTRDENPVRDDEYGVHRAYVTIADPNQERPGESPQTQKDRALWEAMDKAADDVAKVFAGSQEFEVFTPTGTKSVAPEAKLRELVPYTSKDDPNNPGRRDGLGTTHHEAGTLRMGDNPATSVTNAEGRFHRVTNAYALGPALFPTIGSPNPMLTGIALARRTVDRLVPPLLEEEYRFLFDGTEATFRQWQAVGRGSFQLLAGAIVAQPGADLGLLYYPETFGDFILRLQFRLNSVTDNSGVFVRSRDPRQPVPDRTNPGITYPYDNQAWVAVHTGFEVQIDEMARLDKHHTGAIYDVPTGQDLEPKLQNYRRPPALGPGDWNEYEITVIGEVYTVRLKNNETTTFANALDTFRGRSPRSDPAYGYIGLQAHTGPVAFRHIRIKGLE